MNWRGGAFPHAISLEGGPPIVGLRGVTIAGGVSHGQSTRWQLRDDLTLSGDWGGRHDMKLGAEYQRIGSADFACYACNGSIDARGGPLPAGIETAFAGLDASQWDFSIVSPVTNSVTAPIARGGKWDNYVSRNVLGGWLQDDWRVADRLTLNLGVRYDWDSNGHGEQITFLPWLPGNTPRDNNNVAPRVGVNYTVDDRTVVRGGYGLFFGLAYNGTVQTAEELTNRIDVQVFNDGRPDFVPNWFGSGPSREGEFGGPKPTYADALQRACDQNPALFEQWRARGFTGQRPCLVRSVNNPGIPYDGQQTPTAIRRRWGSSGSSLATWPSR